MRITPRDFAGWCAVALPPALMSGRAAPEVLIAVIDLLFVIESVRTRSWSWLRETAFALALPWWGWMVLASLHGLAPLHATVQALAALRFLVLIVALGDWALDDPARRRWLAIAFSLSVAVLVAEVWDQFLRGVNLRGAARWGDGALTGPFIKPRAGPAYVLAFFPAILPPVAALLACRGMRQRLLGVAVALVAVVTMVLIGQRMPTLLMLLGLVAAAALLPRLRLVVGAAVALGALVVAATPVISPATFHKLVIHFLQQMDHFAASDYGQLFIRAGAIGAAHPWLGLGVDSFRIACHQARYAHGFPALGLPGPVGGANSGCNLHPHNYMMQAVAAGGAPGLLLYLLAGGAWLWTLFRSTGGEVRRVALFVAALVALWPIASTSDFYSLPNIGWLLVAIGWGLAERGGALHNRSYL